MKLSVLISAIFMSRASAFFLPGIKSALANSFLEQGKEVYFNALMDQILIPNLDSADGKSYLRRNQWICHSTDGNIDFKAEVENNAYVMTIHNV